jgi:ABC-2 type transport system ATP-binding protein
MISVTNLSKSFDQTLAVNSLSMTISPGEVVGFLGPNGAGKSTTMKMLTGFLLPSAGEIIIDGLSVIKEASQVQHKIGYLPEGAPSYGELNVWQVLNFVADTRQLTGCYRGQRLAKVLTLLNLEDVATKKVEALSKGFKRRLGLATALLHDPKILILDEPTDGLDPNQKYQIRELISHLSKDKIVIISTHILEEVSAVCNRAIIIDQGRMIFDGTPQVLVAKDPLHLTIEISFLEPGFDVVYLQSLGQVCQLDACTFLLEPKDKQQAMEQVLALVAQHQWSVKSIKQLTGQLDNVFRQITQFDLKVH